MERADPDRLGAEKLTFKAHVTSLNHVFGWFRGDGGFDGYMFCSAVKNCVNQTVTDRFEGALPYPSRSQVSSFTACEAI